MGFGKSQGENSQAVNFHYDLTSTPESKLNRFVIVLFELLGNNTRALHKRVKVLPMSYALTGSS